jgi:(4-O-methyl)-D-glucuronate---lignin esterase
MKARMVGWMRAVGMAVGVIGIVAGGGIAQAQSAAEIERGFHVPPPSAKPQTLWFWMNGNVSRDGITRDLEAMARVGLGGAMMFDGGSYLPEGPAKYLGPEWRRLMGHAIQEADRLGLTLGMHNAPGWSSSGGPWITPERAMQQLVWTETTVRGGREIDVRLPPPQTNLGYYRDAYVIAFPALAGETAPYDEVLRAITTSDGHAVPKTALSDGDEATSVTLPAGDFLQFEFVEPTTIAAITVRAGASGRFPTLALEASDDAVAYRRVATVRYPGKHGIPPPGVASFPPERAKYFRVTPAGAADLAEVELHRAPRIEDWNFKGNFAYRLGRQIEFPAAGDPAAAIDPAQVIDLSKATDGGGRLRWQAPAGAWTILRVGYTPTGQLNVSASAAGRGLECDKFSREAIEFHFNQVIAKVLAEAGPLAGKSFTGVEIDSYETGMQNWSAALPEEFQRRTGYELWRYLPAVAGGRRVGDAAITERFLFDLRRVEADLMAENYYGRLHELCNAHGLKFYAEGYGQGVFDELQVSGGPDFPMTEYWERTPWTPSRVVKMVASAAHIYGKPVVAGESFTGEEETARWQEYPFSLKILGDEMFGLGLNQMLFHRFAQQPHPTAVPGMTMGPWGFHFDRTNTWFEQSRPWLEYLARAQWMLRQGTYLADVLYFVGERPPDVAQLAMPVLPAGYNFDLVNAEVLLTRAAMKDGRIAIAGGGNYRLLMLPPDLQGATPELMRQLREFAAGGATIFGPKPQHSLTLRGFPAGETEVRAIADELWNGVGKAKTGRVVAQGGVGEVLRASGVEPDFEFAGRAPDAAVSWLHRATPELEIYFVGNRQRRVEEGVASFRVEGASPEIWRPETGRREGVAVFAAEGGRTRVPLRLEAGESVFVVFRRGVKAKPAGALRREGQAVVSAVAPAPTPPKASGNSFTMSVWAKPDIDLRGLPREGTSGWIDETGKFYAVPAAEGDGLFGPGHTMAGLAIGRNGAYVIERSSTKAPAVLVAKMPVAGWTHFAVVYRDGRPLLYVNGKLAREGLVSGDVVHPGIGSPPPTPGTAYHFTALDGLLRASGLPPMPSQGQAFYFEGNMSRPELVERALEEPEIARLAARGLPPPEEPAVAEVARETDAEDKVTALIWRSGAYALGGMAPVKVEVAAPVEIGGPWAVVFPPERGGPAAITLPQLMSWHRHADPGVKFFSGTATYRRTITVPAEFVASDRRIVLDLGRVEVIAGVKLNGRDCGIWWKEPYRADVTAAARAGTNELEITVTNLWANRLIGDEARPVENDYATGSEHGILALPGWYTRGEPKPPGGRVTFATWKFYTADEPLLESGLLGPVRLLNPVVRRWENEKGSQGGLP